MVHATPTEMASGIRQNGSAAKKTESAAADYRPSWAFRKCGGEHFPSVSALPRRFTAPPACRNHRACDIPADYQRLLKDQSENGQDQNCVAGACPLQPYYEVRTGSAAQAGSECHGDHATTASSNHAPTRSPSAPAALSGDWCSRCGHFVVSGRWIRCSVRGSCSTRP
jgi:hypothetical protein